MLPFPFLSLVIIFYEKRVRAKTRIKYIHPSIITSIFTSSPENLRWIQVKCYLYLRDAILAFKSTTGQIQNYLSSNFISGGSIGSQLTRSSTQLNKLLFKTKLGQRSFYYRTKTLWNALRPIFKVRGISYDF